MAQEIKKKTTVKTKTADSCLLPVSDHLVPGGQAGDGIHRGAVQSWPGAEDYQ